MHADVTQETLRLLSIGASTGALEVQDGAVYLHRGRITFAESRRTPDLRTRLVRSGSLSEARWRALTTGSAGLAERARQERMPPDLLPVLRSTVLDAASALLQGARTTKYHPGRRHWAGNVVQWDVEQLLREVAAMPAPGAAPDDDVPELRPSSAAVLLEAADWPLLAHIDGQASTAAIAWRHGLQLAAVRAGVARLSAAGVCRTNPAAPAPLEPEPVIDAPPPGAPRHLSPIDPPIAPPIDPELKLLPRRRRRDPKPPPDTTRTTQFAQPRDPVLLRRVLAGLRRMD